MGFVLLHGIDGFSCLVTFDKFSTNNCATTVLEIFREAVARYGHPVRIRTNHGGKNVEIWRYMVETHGEDSHNCGKFCSQPANRMPQQSSK